MKFTWRDETFTGSPEEIVAEMNETAFCPDPSPAEYRKSVAERVALQSGAQIPTSSDLDFLRGLHNAGVGIFEEFGPN